MSPGIFVGHLPLSGHLYLTLVSSPMKILEATSIAVGIPFREQISHQLKARKQTASLVVQVTTVSGTMGYGEGAPRDYVTGETMAGL